MPNLHTYLHPRVKGTQDRHLPPLLRFIPQFAQICSIFALSKFEENPVFVQCSFFELGVVSFRFHAPRYSQESKATFVSQPINKEVGTRK